MPGDINAGTYLLEPSALEGWPRGENVSIERQIFPALIAEGRPLAGFVSEAYWMDLGTPEAYLQAQFDLLDERVDGHRPYPSPFVDAGGRIDEGATVNDHVVVGPNATIDAGAQVRDSVLHERADGGARRGRRAIDPRPGSTRDAGRLGDRFRARRGRGRGHRRLGHEGRVRPGEPIEP